MQTPEETDEEGFTFKRRKRSPDAMTLSTLPPTFSSSIMDHASSGKTIQSYQKQQLSAIQQFSPASPISPTTSKLQQRPQSIPGSKTTLDYYTQLSEKPLYATFETDSFYLADDDSDNGESWQMQAQPPSNISVSEYYKHVKTDMPDALRMKQILLWGVKQLLEDGGARDESHKDKTVQKAEKIASRIKEHLLQKLKNGDIDTSWYRRPLITENTLGERKPNPRNVRNEKSIKDHEARIKVFKDEQDQWRKATSKIFESHAAAIDSCMSSPGDLRVTYSDTYLDFLDSDQKAFLQTCGGRRAKLDIDKTISSMDSGINTIRQTLNSADQFQQLAGQYAEKLMGEIARRLDRSTRCLPADEGASVVDQERGDEQLQEMDSRRAIDILRVLSRCQ